MKYIHNEIVKPFRVRIVQQAERVHNIHDMDEYLPPTLRKGDMYDEANLIVRDCNFTEDDIHVATKDGLPCYMQDDME